jgi:hypothetical protein
MKTEHEMRELVSDAFEEAGLVVGGLVAERCIEDDVVWSLVRSLDAIRERTLDRIDETARVQDSQSASPSGPRPHPAVEDFLQRVREGRS